MSTLSDARAADDRHEVLAAPLVSADARALNDEAVGAAAGALFAFLVAASCLAHHDVTEAFFFAVLGLASAAIALILRNAER
jgi:predicted benzoate:H+ symporter BenE